MYVSKEIFKIGMLWEWREAMLIKKLPSTYGSNVWLLVIPECTFLWLKFKEKRKKYNRNINIAQYFKIKTRVFRNYLFIYTNNS